MKYRDIVGAIPSIKKLMTQDLPLQTSYRLHKLIQSINKELEFFSERRSEILSKHEFSQQAAIAELDELLDMQIDWEFSPLRIELSSDIKFSVEDIVQIEPFVEFVEKEGTTDE